MRVMELPPLPKGFIWWNAAPIVEAPDWKQVPQPADWARTTDDILRDGDRLFGYDRQAFLNKQYRN